MANGDGFGDRPQPGFAAGGTSMEAYESLYRLVLTAYGYRCALTGEQFAPEPGLLHSRLEVVAIRPREHGGPLQISNYLPIVWSLARAFSDGAIFAEDDYRIVVPKADLIEPSVAARLRSALWVPVEPLFQPGQAYLAHHRRFALGG